MGCSNCGTGANGKPAGCKSNGGCSSGGCNRLNVFDWLSTIPLQNGVKPYSVVEVTFNKGSRKDYFKNSSALPLQQGDWILVEGMGGFDMGQVNLTGELVRFQLKKYNIDESTAFKKILRPAAEADFEVYHQNKLREKEIMTTSRAMAKQLNLEMKIGEVEVQADGKKATFFYTADGRIDFRELIKMFASEFKLKVEMKQIGARQESAKVGGIGSCGRELCCSTWLSDFKSVNTTAARYQNLSINQTKLSGQCGRLKCCLNYELDTYMDALRGFPDKAEALETVKGKAMLQKRDIFKNLMWYSYQGSNKTYPLDIERVNEILKQNRNGQKPDDLQPVELETVTTRRSVVQTGDVGFVNDVGQMSLSTLEKRNRTKHHKGKKPQAGNKQARPQEQKQARPQQDNKPNRPHPNKVKQEGENRPPMPKTARDKQNKNPNQNPNQKGNQNQQNRNRKGPRPDQSSEQKPKAPDA